MIQCRTKLRIRNGTLKTNVRTGSPRLPVVKTLVSQLTRRQTQRVNNRKPRWLPRLLRATGTRVISCNSLSNSNGNKRLNSSRLKDVLNNKHSRINDALRNKHNKNNGAPRSRPRVHV